MEKAKAEIGDLAVDLDDEVLEWGRLNNLSQLSMEEQSRIELLEEDVLDTAPELADIVLAMNFSYYIFDQRAVMRQYFESVREALAS